MNILLVVVILLVLIVAHEFGHFVAAKRAGIRVDEFGIGFPPRAWGKKIGETLYSINWLPFGGFVKIFGEDPNAEDITTAEQGKSFYFKSTLTKASILVAGVVFNWLLAWVLISIVFMLGVPTLTDSTGDLTNGETVVTEVLPESPAARAGLASGDTVLFIETAEGRIDSPTITEVQETIGAHPGEVITMGIRPGSGEEVRILEVMPEYSEKDDRGLVGVALATATFVKHSFFSAIKEGFIMTARMTKLTLVSFGELFKNIFAGDRSLLASVSGPVGLVGLVGQASQFGVASVLFLAALISINLSIINLVPFPALDGGRLLFLIIEKIKGSPIPRKAANITNAVGFALLILLMVLVTYNDIVKL